MPRNATNSRDDQPPFKQGVGSFPAALLFICTHNVIRSPMAAALYKSGAPRHCYVASAGVLQGEADPFVWATMNELNIDMSLHEPQTLAQLDDSTFDMIISLSPQAHHHAMEMTRTMAVEVIYWPMLNPAVVHGNRAQRMQAYRDCRDDLKIKLINQFSHLES